MEETKQTEEDGRFVLPHDGTLGDTLAELTQLQRYGKGRRFLDERPYRVCSREESKDEEDEESVFVHCGRRRKTRTGSVSHGKESGFFSAQSLITFGEEQHGKGRHTGFHVHNQTPPIFAALGEVGGCGYNDRTPLGMIGSPLSLGRRLSLQK